jgi:3-phenylpropionate/cinnamic acid dioxygenase small subunit
MGAYDTIEGSTLRERIEDFLFLEARLQDEHRYSEWEALWDEGDTLYWVPIGSDCNPETDLSYIYDNRRRLASRVRQLNTGKRHAQMPRSNLSKVVSNIRFERTADGIRVFSRFVLLENRRSQIMVWGGEAEHLLRDSGDGFRIVRKIVRLVNSDEPITTLAFLI